MARVWTTVRIPVLLVLAALSVVVLTVGPFDPDVAGSRAAQDRAGRPNPADAFLLDLEAWPVDAQQLYVLGQADCEMWRQQVLPVGEPAATMGQDVADPQARAIADAANRHLCPELT